MFIWEVCENSNDISKIINKKNMKTVEAIFIDNYFGLLRGLNREVKIQIMARLSDSIAKETSKEDVIDKFFGAFDTEKSAEEMIEEIRNSRVFTRTIEPF